MQLSSLTTQFLVTCESPIVLAVSGWPDSMCLVTLIRNFWIEQWRSLTNLHVAHYHHGLRLQSDEERDLVINYCHDMTVHVWYYDGWSRTERDLRVARHAFFQSVMEEVWGTVLVTGHNLTDRIETSLMNMKRGCAVVWFCNMRQQEVKKKRKKGEIMPLETILLRPLLNYSKQDIQKLCNEQQIPHMIDQSNFDVTVSARNKIRAEIVMRLTDQELQHRRDLYTQLELSQPMYDDPVRDDEMQGWYVWQVGEWSLDYLAQLFDWSGCYADMTQGRLLERQKWIAHSFSGEKFVWWWRRWIKSKKVWISMV